MSTDLMEKPVEYMANGETVKLTANMIAQYLVRGDAQVTSQEIVMFMNLCKFQKLNPFLNEAYLVKFNGAPAQIITSKEAFMKRAEANEHYSGLEAGIIVERGGELVNIEGAIKLPTDKLIGGWAKVHRDDRNVPTTVQISLSEFTKGQATWNKMPMNMIRKTAIVNAMREAFPGTLGSMYTQEESDESERKDITQEVNREVQKKANHEIIDVQPEPVKESKAEKQKAQTVENDPVGDFEQASKKAPF
ncbi:phage recombination protein Bet [Sporolactobacillus terrae]|uniref:phage recombination protein Bet n=1 Tax=Sporolactobacillus terrae TaxID=269673 RepID=UPI000686DE39|nr:phage recombination protein Bet [Sporolactobacillus terrae]